MGRRRKKLSDVDIEVIRQFCTVGVAALYDEGMTGAQIVAFMERSDVQEKIALFAAEYNQQDSLLAMTRFSALRAMSRMALDAVDVLQQAVAGPEYETKVNAEGETVFVLNLHDGKPRQATTEPTSTQMQATKEILDRLGVVKPQHTDLMIHANVGGLLSEQQAPVEVVTDRAHVTEEQRALSRERVRKVISQLTKTNAVATAIKRVKSKVVKSKPLPKPVPSSKKG